MRHRPLLSLGPVNRWTLLRVMVTWVFVNVASHPLLQSCPMESTAWLVSPGKIWASVACDGRSGKLMWQVWVDQMLLPSGSLTWMGLVVVTLFVQGLLVRM